MLAILKSVDKSALKCLFAEYRTWLVYNKTSQGTLKI